jgi:hypothetical protein
MQAQYGIRQGNATRLVQLALAVALLVVFAVAGGYAIRMVTTSAPVAAPSHAAAVQSAAPGAGAVDRCVIVDDRKAC